MTIKSTESLLSDRGSSDNHSGGPMLASPERLPEAARLEIERLQAEIAVRDSRLQAIQEIGRAQGSTLSLDQVLTLIMTRITYLMDADRSTLFLLDAEHNELWSKVLQGTRVSEIRLKVGRGIAGWVAQTGKSINIKDAYRDPRFDRNTDITTGYQTRSCLCQPIRNQERRIIGVVQVLNKHRGHFTVEDENLLSAIASQAAVSIENSKLYLSVVAKNIELLEYKERLEQKMYELDILYEIEQESSSAESLDTLLESIAYRAIDIVDASACAIVLDERGRGLSLYGVRRTRRENGQQTLRAVPLPVNKGSSARILSTGEPLLELPSDLPIEEEVACSMMGIEPRSLVGVPISSEDKLIGCLQVFNKSGFDEFSQPNEFTEEDLKLLTLIGSRISRAIATQLQRERRAKADRLSAIGQMLSSVLHDLKTPISIIRGYAQLMVRQDKRETREEYAASIFKQFDTLNSMTKEVLAFARGESTILLRKTHFAKVMSEVEQMMRDELGDRPIALNVNINYRGVARLDEVKIKRLFANLLRNAIEAMGSEAGNRLSVSADRDEQNLVLTFSDNGRGIPLEIRSRLFESFVTKGKKHGTGLGLAIVKKIVDEHRGSIQFETETDQGTTFIIHIPLGIENA